MGQAVHSRSQGLALLMWGWVVETYSLPNLYPYCCKSSALCSSFVSFMSIRDRRR